MMALGLWAGGASAQADDGGWFDSESGSTSPPAERPVLKIHGEGPYDPPPADFQSEPAAPVYEDEKSESTDSGEFVDEATEAEGQREAVREFSPHLAPYGRWVDDPYYGRIWVPARTVVGSDFAPYVSAGHWELTVDDEWLWVSDYPFGWVTFHYGHWVWGAGGYGWGWVPGYRYAPAWVDFRIGAAGYVGWGPAAPRYAWRSGVFVSLGLRRPLPYVFCPTTYVFAPTLHRHVIRDRYRVRSIGAQTYRYRPQRVAGVYTRSPRLVEAGIPSRAVPTRRVVARPRVGDSQGNILRSGSVRASNIERRASARDPGTLRRDAAFPAAQPVRRAPAAGRASTNERFEARGANLRSARPATTFDRFDGRSSSVRGSRPAAAGGRMTPAPAVRSRSSSSFEDRNVWRDGAMRRGGDSAIRRGGDGAIRRPGGVQRSNAIPQSNLRPSPTGRQAPSAWTDRTQSAAPRLAAPRVREPVTVPAARRAAPVEPVRASGAERRSSEARGSSGRSHRGGRAAPAARPSERARSRSGSSR